jgi:hypothetical protein
MPAKCPGQQDRASRPPRSSCPKGARRRRDPGRNSFAQLNLFYRTHAAAFPRSIENCRLGRHQPRPYSRNTCNQQDAPEKWIQEGKGRGDPPLHECPRWLRRGGARSPQFRDNASWRRRFLKCHTRSILAVGSEAMKRLRAKSITNRGVDGQQGQPSSRTFTSSSLVAISRAKDSCRSTVHLCTNHLASDLSLFESLRHCITASINHCAA